MKKLKIVDGSAIRNALDVDFSVIGDHQLYPYIKKNEIWLDQAFIKEKNFFLKMFARRKDLMKKHGYEKAKALLRPTFNKKSLAEIIVKKQPDISKAKVYLVNGALVRKTVDPGFCFGGHWLVYEYIPKNQIWLDDKTPDAEKKYVLRHELAELKLMAKGKRYNNAHDYAGAVEKEARRKDGARYLKD